MTVAYVCEGCGKRIDAATSSDLGPLPGGWFYASELDQPLARRELAATITACSADCIQSAKDSARRYWAKWSVRQQAIIQGAIFKRAG